jgi:hypothetical protein
LHEQKLAAYVRDPDANDHRGFLKDARNNPERREQIIQGRVRGLEKQIENFKRLIREAREGTAK